MRLDRWLVPFASVHLPQSLHILVSCSPVEVLCESLWHILFQMCFPHPAMPFHQRYQRLKAKSANNGGGCDSATSGGASAFPTNSQPNSAGGVLLSMPGLDNLDWYIWICCKLWYVLNWNNFTTDLLRTSDCTSYCILIICRGVGSRPMTYHRASPTSNKSWRKLQLCTASLLASVAAWLNVHKITMNYNFRVSHSGRTRNIQNLHIMIFCRPSFWNFWRILNSQLPRQVDLRCQVPKRCDTL